MKLGELFIELGVVGDTKELKTALRDMKKGEEATKTQLKLEEKLKRALTDKEKALIKNSYALANGISNMLKMATAVTGFTLAIDRMINGLAQANQHLISFQRQTGISLATLNKYASASSAVNYNATIEGTANSLQNLANNLWDIRMGRGDISPYQELAFVGGKAINVWGKSVEQVIEEVRESIKSVGDVQATNIITRMGFSPDDLLMLRMTKEEFAEIQGMFLSPKDREAMYQYGLQLKKTHLQFSLLGQQILLKIMPAFVEFLGHVSDMASMWFKVAENVGKFLSTIPELKSQLVGLATTLFIAFQPVLATFTALYLILEDLAVYFMGGKSITGLAIEGLRQFGEDMRDNAKKFGDEFTRGVGNIFSGIAGVFRPAGVIEPTTSVNSNRNFNQNNNLTINTSQPVDKVVGEKILNYSNIIGQNAVWA